MKTILYFITLCFVCTGMNAQVRVQTNPDGTTYAPVLVNGPTHRKINIVFLGDGITEEMQNGFSNFCAISVRELLRIEPYRTRECSFNFWRVNVVSTDNGIDNYNTGLDRDTELDGIDLVNNFGGASWEKCFEAAAHAPAADFIVVLLNSSNPLFRASAPGDRFIFASISLTKETFAHELGHLLGLLSDEYVTGYEPYEGAVEPLAVNLARNITRDGLKWKADVLPGTPLPTSEFNLMTPDPVGAWDTSICPGLYRPQKECYMRSHEAGKFCAICYRYLDNFLRGICPPEYDYGYAEAQTIGLARTLDFNVLGIPIFRRWPFPVCLTCPPIRLEKIQTKLQLSGENLESLDITIADNSGKQIVKAVPLKNMVELEFTQIPESNYFLQILPKKATEKQTFKLDVKLFQNGKEIEL